MRIVELPFNRPFKSSNRGGFDRAAEALSLTQTALTRAFSDYGVLTRGHAAQL